MSISKIIICVVSLGFMLQAKAESAAEILLKESDRGRGGIVEGLQWTAEVETVEKGESSSREFFIKAKADNAHVEATLPARNKGEIFLFNDRNMWFFKPNLKKPVSISARQKLVGQAANGDIASTHYARDYSATIEKSETIDGQKTAVLMLVAKNKSLTYDKIRYWIREKDKLAIKAEFLTLNGVVFKIATIKYDNTLSLNGKTFPFVSQLEIADAKYANNKSIIKYKNPKVVNLVDTIFNINNLTR